MSVAIDNKLVDAQGLKAVVASELRYTGEEVTATVGGVNKGTIYENARLIDVLDEVLHPYVAPTIGTISVTPTPTVYENGASVNVTKVSVTITKGSKDYTYIGLPTSTTNVESIALDEANASTSYTYTETGNALYTFTKSSSVKYVQVMVTDASGKSVTKNSSSFSFVYPYYYGVVDSGVSSPTATNITSLTKLVQVKGTKTLAFTAANQRMVFASPYAVAKILDANSFDVTDTFTLSKVLITGLDGTAQSYYVYTSEPTTVTSFNNTFSH